MSLLTKYDTNHDGMISMREMLRTATGKSYWFGSSASERETGRAAFAKDILALPVAQIPRSLQFIEDSEDRAEITRRVKAGVDLTRITAEEAVALVWTGGLTHADRERLFAAFPWTNVASQSVLEQVRMLAVHPERASVLRELGSIAPKVLEEDRDAVIAFSRHLATSDGDPVLAHDKLRREGRTLSAWAIKHLCGPVSERRLAGTCVDAGVTVLSDVYSGARPRVAERAAVVRGAISHACVADLSARATALAEPELSAADARLATETQLRSISLAQAIIAAARTLPAGAERDAQLRRAGTLLDPVARYSQRSDGATFKQRVADLRAVIRRLEAAQPTAEQVTWSAWITTAMLKHPHVSLSLGTGGAETRLTQIEEHMRGINAALEDLAHPVFRSVPAFAAELDAMARYHEGWASLQREISGAEPGVQAAAALIMPRLDALHKRALELLKRSK